MPAPPLLDDSTQLLGTRGRIAGRGGGEARGHERSFANHHQKLIYLRLSVQTLTAPSQVVKLNDERFKLCVVDLQ